MLRYQALRRLHAVQLPIRVPDPSIYLSKPLETPTTLRRRPYTTSSSLRLSGRTCLITGGTSGIGFAIAQRFLQEDAARVILVGRSYQRLIDAAARLGTRIRSGSDDSDNAGDKVATRAPEEDQQVGRKENGVEEAEDGGRVGVFVADVSEAGGWVRDIEKAMSTVDILINAAGISSSTLLPKQTPESISQILRTNLESALLTSRAFMRASMRSRPKNRPTPNEAAEKAQPKQPPKCIINISSLLAYKFGTGAVPYAASKAGILGLSRALAVEAGGLIRSNVIVPGYIGTPMTEGFSESETTRLTETIPLKRFGDAAEVADAAVFLAGNEYANNCVLNLDGGLNAV